MPSSSDWLRARSCKHQFENFTKTSHVVQVIVRHGDKYYNTNGKHNLIPLLITIMTRLGTSSTAEHRQLAVKVASLLVDWQKQSFDEGNEVLIEKRHGDSVIHFIIKQMILYFPNPAQTEMLNKCKTIFSNIYQYQLWTDVLIRSGIHGRSSGLVTLDG